MIRSVIRKYPATLTFLILIYSMYLAQLLIAGSFGSNAAFRTIESLPQIGVLWANPWLHSTHNHILQNSLLFALFGFWTEKRVDSNRFAVAVLVAGYATNMVPPVLGFGGWGVGASGITNMLVAYFTAVQLSAYSKATQEDVLDIQKAGLHLLLFFLGLILVLKSVAEFTGYITPEPGIATGGHMLGVILGFTWFILRNTENPLRRIRYKQTT